MSQEGVASHAGVFRGARISAWEAKEGANFKKFYPPLPDGLSAQ